MDKYIIAAGGGEIKNKTTLEIDRVISGLAKAHAGEKRANALFLGTASHDSMPYFNSFRKTYTSVFDIKADVALIVYGEMNAEHIREKFERADCIYIGGGDTLFMLEKWKEAGITEMVLSAYESGKVIFGLSAGAICWFKKMYTDYEIMRGTGGEYVIREGLGVLPGAMCPHYDERRGDFLPKMISENIPEAYCAENNAAIVFKNGRLFGSLTSGGKAYVVKNIGGKIEETPIPPAEL